jgi:phosphatidylethanolamine/phosphatidyl-N-methylethanolamine N-methyltransferase
MNALLGGHRLRTQAVRVTDATLLKLMSEQAARVKVKLVPVLAYCERVAVPTVVGVLRPMILLPASLMTGLSLPTYGRHLEIVGIDLSPEMLEKARERVAEERLTNVTGLHEMDAGELQFEDASFDTVVAMYVMTVVPDPEKVMRELSRVCRVGGDVIIVNHFSAEEGMRGWVERRMAPFADMLGWRPVFDIERVLVCEDLTLMEKRGLRPWGLFTMMRFRKAKEVAAAA